MSSKKNKPYSESIIELVKFQHEIDSLKDQADEKEIQAASIQQDAINLRTKISEKSNDFLLLGEKHYPITKINEMISTCEDEAIIALLTKIQETILTEGYTIAIIHQLYTIDVEVNNYIHYKFQLNFFGKIDSFLSKITGTE